MPSIQPECVSSRWPECVSSQGLAAYCGLVEAALWLELPAQLVEYYWDVGHVGHAVGRLCRGKLAHPDGIVQEVGVDAGWHFREAIPWTRQALRFLPVGCVEHSAGC